eukprot:TCONS_00073008-protein
MYGAIILLIFCTWNEQFSYVFGETSDIGYGMLTRRQGVELDHKEIVDLGNGKRVEVITKALKPLLFEIPDFLSEEECDHIIKRALDPQEGGIKLFDSQAKGGLTSNETLKAVGVNGQSLGWLGRYEGWDKDGDGNITIEEIISIAHLTKTLVMEEPDIRDIFKAVGQPSILDDDIITKEEFQLLSTLAVEKYLDNLWQNHPRFKPRTSQQAWLFMEQWLDPTVHNIRERLVRLSGLPREIIYGGEMLQVVHYTTNGHYHAHHDSETHLSDHVPCCHQYSGDTLGSTGECKLCRFLTFMMYLNDVEDGGQTAFPMAHEEVFDTDQIRQHGNASTDKYNLSYGCKIANLVVKPKKGKAVLWYNHLVNQTDGWMGELDPFSLHGGCDVKSGEKWISNMWITAPFGKDVQTPSIFLNRKDFKMAEEKFKEQNKKEERQKEEL